MTDNFSYSTFSVLRSLYSVLLPVTSALFIIFTYPSYAQDPIRIVGSTAVYPFATMVAERLGKTGTSKAPVVEATGTGGGIKIFCAGSGKNYPDIVTTSRAMTEEEKHYCRQNGVNHIIEYKIGYDGIVIGAHPSQNTFPLTRVQLSQALSEKVEKNNAWIANPYHSWQEVDPSLPDQPINVLGPTSSLATREVFEEMVIKKGCQKYATDPKACIRTIREDGPYIEVAEHENVVVQKLALKPQSIGFLSYGYYQQNPNKVKAMKLDGILPTPQTISDHTYPLVRPLYIYVKEKSLKDKPDLQAFINELFSENAMGEHGYLRDKGLIRCQ